VPIRNVAEVIGRQLDVPVVSISADDAGEHFTWLADFIGVDSPASSRRSCSDGTHASRADCRPRAGALFRQTVAPPDGWTGMT